MARARAAGEMGLDGDWSKLRRMLGELNEAASGRLMRPITLEAEEGVQDEYLDDFRAQHDPWGVPWDAAEDGENPVLIDSGALAGAQVTSVPGLIRIRPPKYWVFHQLGANNMRKRAVLPFAKSDWDEPIQKRITLVVERHFKTKD